MNKSTLLYGIAGGICLTLYITLLDMSGVIYNTSWGPYLGYLAVLILPLCILIALQRWRRQHAGILLKHSILTGLLISLAAATVYSAYTFIDITFFDARHLDNLFRFTREEMLKAGYSASDISEKISEMQTYYFSSKPYISTYIWYLAMGLIFSLLFHFILRFIYKSANTKTI